MINKPPSEGSKSVQLILKRITKEQGERVLTAKEKLTDNYQVVLWFKKCMQKAGFTLPADKDGIEDPDGLYSNSNNKDEQGRVSKLSWDQIRNNYFKDNPDKRDEFITEFFSTYPNSAKLIDYLKGLYRVEWSKPPNNEQDRQEKITKIKQLASEYLTILRDHYGGLNPDNGEIEILIGSEKVGDVFWNSAENKAKTVAGDMALYEARSAIGNVAGNAAGNVAQNAVENEAENNQVRNTAEIIAQGQLKDKYGQFLPDNLQQRGPFARLTDIRRLGASYVNFREVEGKNVLLIVLPEAEAEIE